MKTTFIFLTSFLVGVSIFAETNVPSGSALIHNFSAGQIANIYSLHGWWAGNCVNPSYDPTNSDTGIPKGAVLIVQEISFSFYPAKPSFFMGVFGHTHAELDRYQNLDEKDAIDILSLENSLEFKKLKVHQIYPDVSYISNYDDNLYAIRKGNGAIVALVSQVNDTNYQDLKNIKAVCNFTKKIK